MEKMSLEQKLMCIYEVSSNKSRVEQLLEQLDRLVILAQLYAYSPSPMNKFAAEFIIAAHAGEHGELLRDTQAKLESMYERLRDCGGDTAAVIGIKNEMTALKSQLERIDRSFEELYDAISAKKKEFVEMN